MEEELACGTGREPASANSASPLHSPCFPYPCSQADSASLSASLLADWLEGHGMNPADIESLQREIQMDSPMLLADLPDLQEP